jgi:hypothetical protein
MLLLEETIKSDELILTWMIIDANSLIYLKKGCLIGLNATLLGRGV